MWTSIKQWVARCRAFFFKSSDLDREFNDELESHVAMIAEEYVRRGMDPEQARREARIQVGASTQLQEAHREVRGLPFLDTLLQDLRYTLRTLRRDAGFTTFATLIVALGIGASSTVFSVVNTLLIRPLPFQDPSQLVWISNTAKAGDLSGLTVPVGAFLDMRAQTQSISDVAAYFAFYGIGDSKMTGAGEPERFTGVPVSQRFFPLLGIQPQLGRVFTPDECKSIRTSAVMLSHNLWTRRFASDPSIVGRQLTLNDRSFTVVGVTPAEFDFGSIFAPGTRVDLYFPLPLTPEVNSMGNTLSMVGRLKPGFTAEQANAELATMSEPIRIRNDRGSLKFRAGSLDEHVSGQFRPALLVLSCAVGVVMLIVCANLCNLQLARTSARQKEIAIRVAMGAGRGRLIRQMLTESVVLSCGAGLLGLLLAFAGTRLLTKLDAISIPLRESIHVDGSALGFTLLIAILTGVIVGLVPALRAHAEGGLHDSLKDANRGSSEGKSQHWIRSSLVIAEIAFACVLLVGAGLLIRSFLRVLDVDLGFRPAQAAALRVDPSQQYDTFPKRNAYFTDLLSRVQNVPGIESAGLTDVLPLGHNRSWSVGAKGESYSQSHPPPDAFVRIVSEGYVRVMGMSLRAGREFSAGDINTAPKVIMINETLARILFPGRNPIGQTVMFADGDREVVGVVGDVRHVALEQGAGGEIYLPIRQSGDYAAVDLVIRTKLPAASLASAVREALRPIDPNLPANEFRTLQQLVDKSVSPRRFVVILLGGFSAFALVLASLGIYGVIAYSVAQRTQEIGIRMALGASARELQGQVIFQTLRLAALGMLIGVAASWILTKALSGMLFGVTSTDPITFAGMLLILTAVGALAGYLPARRASRIDPMLALRSN